VIVVDTNVIIRVITKDDLDQTRLAVDFLSRAGTIWISRVVLLEVGWTLRSRYKYSPEAVNQALSMLVALDQAQVEDAETVQQALRYHGTGMDLGDAFILAFAPEGSTVYTFDSDFVRRGREQRKTVPVQEVAAGVFGKG